MAAINNDDFIDFDGINRELDKLDKRFGQWGKSIIDVYDKIHNAQERGIDDLKRYEAAIKSINVKSPSAGSGLAGASKDVEATIASIEKYNATMGSMQNLTDLSERSIAELRVVVSTLKKEYDALDPAATDFANEQSRISGQVKVATQAIKAQEIMMKQALRATNDLNGSYNKLAKETTELKNQLRQMPNAFDLVTGAINKQNKQAVIWQQTIERNEAALRKMDSSMGNYHRNVGNYSSAFSGLNASLSGLIAPILGVSTAYEALHKSVQIIDELTRVRLGLEAVSSSSQQVTRRWEFLSELADKTGQDITKLSQVYVNFAGSTRGTALEGAAGDKIFKSFSNTFSALGKSSEVAERGLYAVQQMISKTKVNSEELNQQLAEALPGANKILADSMKVTTAELADMMKKGKVLSVDVLPAMAAALDKIYGAQAQKNVNTISGSWTRLTTQFKLFLDNLNEDNAISGFFARLNNGIADAIRNMRTLVTDTDSVRKRAGVIMENQSTGMKALGSVVPGVRQGAAIYNASQQVGKESAANNQLVATVQSVSSSAKRAAIVKKEEEDLKKLTRAYHDFKIQTDDSVVSTETMRTKTVALFGAMDQQRKLVEALNKAEADRIKQEKEEANIAGRPKGGGVGGDGDDGADKKKLTQFEKLIKAAEKYRGIIIDDLLADSKAGRALEPSDEALAKWKELYEQIRVVSDAVGDQIPANLRELNAKLTKQPEDIANQIPIVSMEQDEKPAAEKSEIVDLTKYNALLQVHEEENELLKKKIGQYGILRYVSKDYLDQLLPEQQKIQDLEKQYAIEQIEAKKQAINEEIQLEKQKFQQIMELARAEAQGKRELQQASFELAVESSNAIFKIISDQREADRESLQMQMEHELSLVQGNEAAQERIKKEYAKKDLELRQKQARLEKAQAAFSIGISTARAVVNALATGGPPWIGIALAAIVGAMGAIQLAAVLAKPLPQFFKGTDNAPAGPAWIAERGPEIIESKGKQTLVQKKSIVPLRRGDKVYTAAETRAIMASQGRREGVGQMFDRTEASRARREDIYRAQAALNGGSKAQAIDYDKVTESFGKALDQRPVDQTFIDEQGVHRRYIRKNSTTTYHNSRYSLK